MREEKSGVRYFSFLELPFPVKKNKKQNNDELRERFEKRHTCVVCHQPLSWVKGTNIMSCRNPDCKGKKIEKTLSDGTVKIDYKPYFHILDIKGTEIAEKLYNEE